MPGLDGIGIEHLLKTIFSRIAKKQDPLTGGKCISITDNKISFDKPYWSNAIETGSGDPVESRSYIMYTKHWANITNTRYIEIYGQITVELTADDVWSTDVIEGKYVLQRDFGRIHNNLTMGFSPVRKDIHFDPTSYAVRNNVQLIPTTHTEVLGMIIPSFMVVADSIPDINKILNLVWYYHFEYQKIITPTT